MKTTIWRGAVSLALSVVSLTMPSLSRAETVADRKGAVLKDRATLANDPRWIYNDYELGFAEARRTGKPLLVVLRCIPCLACAGIDAKVLLEDAELSPLLDRFVCVRVINANALDLSRFQFDYDLSFTAMLFNGDGALYGRYGSWAHQKDPQEQTTAGFRKALETTLALHRDYPANRETLKGKQSPPSPYKTPVDMPSLKGKYSRNLDWEGKVVQSCVHCHQIGDALRAAHRERRERIPSRLVYPFPPPETIGLELAADHAARVKKAAPGSIAANVGLRAGDDLVTLGGQPLISIADVSWVLHQAGDSGTIPGEVLRDGQKTAVSLVLPEQWRRKADISRRVGTWEMRAMALGGLLLEDLPDEERVRRGLDAARLALLAKHVGEYGEHAAAKKAGFKKEDIVIEIAGSSKRESESALIGRLLHEYPSGSSLDVVVLRGAERVKLSLPMQ